MGLLSSPDSNTAPCQVPREIVVEVRGLIVGVAAQNDVALHVAMLIPPAVPAEKRLKRVFEEPAVVELVVEAEHGDGADGRFGAVGAFPSSRAGIVGHKAFGGFFAEGFESVGVGQVAVADAGHGGGKEGIPVKDDIAAPADGPDAADGRNHALLFGLVDGVPAERGFNGVDDGAALAGGGDGLLVGGALAVDGGLDFLEGAVLAGADADGYEPGRRQNRSL